MVEVPTPRASAGSPRNPLVVRSGELFDGSQPFLRERGHASREEVRVMLQFRYAAESDTGRVRDNNEDAGFAGPYLLCVADGVGGAAAGEVASATTSYVVSARALAHPGSDPLRLLAAASEEAHEQLQLGVEADPDRLGMATTLTAILTDGSPHRARPHRRLPRLPAARRRVHPAQPRPHDGAGHGRCRPDHPRRGGGVAAPQRRAPGDRRDEHAHAGPAVARPAARRPAAPLQRRRERRAARGRAGDDPHRAVARGSRRPT